MSEFPALDDFEAGVPSGTSQSDFLSRERELLGDEFGGIPSDAPTAFPETEGDLLSPSGNAPAHSNADFMDALSREDPPKSAAVHDDDDLNAFESQFPDVEVPASQPQQTFQQNGFSAPAPAMSQQHSLPQPAESESDAIKQWREKQREEIAARDKKSEEKKKEIINAAEKAIDEFYAKYNEKKAQQIASNKENEAAFLQARDDALAQGTTWERIANMVELNDSRSKTIAKGSKDLGRMKEVLLSLKREGEKAPAAGGY